MLCFLRQNPKVSLWKGIKCTTQIVLGSHYIEKPGIQYRNTIENRKTRNTIEDKTFCYKPALYNPEIKRYFPKLTFSVPEELLKAMDTPRQIQTLLQQTY